MKRRLISIGQQGSNVFNQNLRITQLGKSGRIQDAIKIFSRMPQKNIVTYNSMISAYAKNGRVRDARTLFDKLPRKNLVSWNTMIAGYLHNDKVAEAYELFVEMPEKDLFSWTLMITCYIRSGKLEKSRELLDSLPCKYKNNTACWNAMIAGYSKEGRYDDAKRLFDEMPVKDLVSWNSMLAGYTRNGEMRLALQFFHKIDERNVVSWNLMVDGFVKLGDLDSAWKFFKSIPEPNVVSWVTMLCGFARYGKIFEARKHFDQMPIRNVVSWNAMISAYVQSCQIDEASKLFEEMPERDSVSWTAMINGYVHAGKLDEAREILNKMPYKNIAAQTALISGYIRNNRMDEASKIFNVIDNRDVVCWNTMIAGYTQCGRMDEAIHLFEQMVDKDIVSWNTMIAAYAQAGQMDSALKIFKEMGERNLVSWNSLISGFMLNGLYLDALSFFVLMQHEGKKPDQSTFACVLSSCAVVAALQVGTQLHHLVVKSGYVNDLFVCNALITMYSKCGRISEAELVFKGIEHADIVSWNSLIGGYALNGCGKEAFKLFQEMALEGIFPDQVTFIGLLSACSHAGLIDQGLQLFQCMNEMYAIESLAEHYACIVDLLGRVGRLDEAFEIVKGMKIKANAGVWGALLGACRMHRNLELGKLAAQKLLEFEPDKTSNYVLLSNMHAEAGRWSEVEEVRVSMKDISTGKQPGSSWIEFRNQKKAEFVKDLHTKVRANIERKNDQYAKQANKGRVKVVFEPGDWVWVHLRKERFPTQRKSKLQPRGDGPFQVLEKINDNAYKLDLPSNYGNVSATFSVADLSLFDIGDSRTNHFEEGGNDRDQGGLMPKDPLQGIGGPMTRARTKRMKQALQGLIMEMQDKEVVLEVSKTTPKIITYLYVQEEEQALEVESMK